MFIYLSALMTVAIPLERDADVKKTAGEGKTINEKMGMEERERQKVFDEQMT